MNLNEYSTLEIATKHSETENVVLKEVAVMLVSAKDINHITLMYLNKEGELREKIFTSPDQTEVFFSPKDFLVYDGSQLYALHHHVLIPLESKNSKLLVSPEIDQELKEAGFNLLNAMKKNNPFKR